ncbi:MAG: hypothetical protein NW203_00520 [Hyphomonadaceae bacterium]|nr:hypothetical protein [Hyphomonadaceae bacterium]
MTEEQTAPANDAAPEGDAGVQKRLMSTIEFPYGDLDDAIDFARAIRDVGGVECGIDQVAGYLKQVPSSGAFRLRLSFPRIFGLTENERGIVRLTDLGRRIIEPAHEKACRVEAFLTVPLYRAVFEKYKGFQLPPPAALEREMVALGVSPKQKDKARQAFDRSAKQAGFFWAGPDRLVMPVTGKQDAPPETRPIEAGAPGADEAAVERARRNSGGGDDGGRDDLDVVVAALIKKLPPRGEKFPADARVRWLRQIEMAFQDAYGDADEVEIKKASSNA